MFIVEVRNIYIDVFEKTEKENPNVIAGRRLGVSLTINHEGNGL